MLKFLGKYREAGVLILRASVGLLFIVLCAPVLFEGHRRWAQFGSAMRTFNFHAHLGWWGMAGALLGCIGGVLIVLGLAFRLGLLFAFVIALVNAISIMRHEHSFYAAMFPFEVVVILACLACIGPGKYSVDKD